MPYGADVNGLSFYVKTDAVITHPKPEFRRLNFP